MYLEHVSTGELLTRTDKKPSDTVVGSFTCDSSDRSLPVYTLMLENPSIEPTIADTTPGVDKQNEFIVWLDQQKTRCLGSFVVTDSSSEEYGLKQDSNYYRKWNITGKGFKDLLTRKRFSVDRSNISIKNLIIYIVSEGGTDYGISTDYTYIQDIGTGTIADFEKLHLTAADMLDELAVYGVSWYVDHNKKVHAWDSTNLEYAFTAAGYLIDDRSTLPQSDLNVGNSVGKGLANRIKIIGKNKKSTAIEKKITGTGDPLDSLSFNLEYNPYVTEYRVEEWQTVDTNLWDEIDPGGNIKPGHDGEGYLFASNGILTCWGGTGTIGDVAMAKADFFEYKQDGYAMSTFKIANNGMAYIAGVLDGNGFELDNIVAGFKIDNGQITKLVINGQLYSPTSTINLKHDVYATISNLSSNRKRFDVDPLYTSYLAEGDDVILGGDNLGTIYAEITDITGDTVTINQAISTTADLTNAYIERSPWYNTRILFSETGYEFQIQGESYGQLGSGTWKTIYKTIVEPYIPDYLFEFQVISEDLQVYFERIVVVPPESFSFILDNGEIWSIAPEEYAESAAAQVIIHPAGTDGQPARLGFRGASMMASVARNIANTRYKVYYYGKGNEDEFMTGDRVIIGGYESFVLNVYPDDEINNSGYITLNTNYPLPAVPTYNDKIYCRTTMLEVGSTGTLKYRHELVNAWEFTDDASIAMYGDIEGEPIEDPLLETFTDLENKSIAYLAYNAWPRISGSFSFNISTNITDADCFLASNLEVPQAGQFVKMQSTIKGISLTDVRISSLNLEIQKDDIIKCTLNFNYDDYLDVNFQKKVNRKLINVTDRTKMLFQAKRMADTFGLTDTVETQTFTDSIYSAFYYNTKMHGYYA